MAKVVQKSLLAAKLGNKGKQAFDNVKNNDVEFDTGANLPAGIENGVAQLVECKFGTYESGDNKGELYFLAAGVVCAPKLHEGVSVEGLRTQIGPEPLCDTPTRSRKTVQEHFAWVVNELKKLGLDTGQLELDQIEASCEQLKEVAPFFRFRTWKGSKQEITKKGNKWVCGNKSYATEEKAKLDNPFAGRDPRTQHVWNGLCEFTDEETDDVIEDSPELSGDVVDEATDETTDEMLLEDIGQLADQEESGELEGTEYRDDLTSRAEEAGIDPQEYDTWTDLALTLETTEDDEATDEDEGDEEESESDEGDEGDEDEDTTTADDVWEKGDQCLYKPPKSRKAAECELLTSNQAKRTCTLKRLDDGRKFPNVSWDELAIIQ